MELIKTFRCSVVLEVVSAYILVVSHSIIADVIGGGVSHHPINIQWLNNLEIIFKHSAGNIHIQYTFDINC